MSGHEFQSWFPESGSIDYDDTQTNITEATLDEIATTIHAHPTVSEAVGEAALASWGRPIHFPKAGPIIREALINPI